MFYEKNKGPVHDHQAPETERPWTASKFSSPMACKVYVKSS